MLLYGGEGVEIIIIDIRIDTRDIWGTFLFSLPFNRSFYSFWLLRYSVIKPARCICLSFAECIREQMQPAQWVWGGSFSISKSDLLNIQNVHEEAIRCECIWGIISSLRIPLLFCWKPWPHSLIPWKPKERCLPWTARILQETQAPCSSSPRAPCVHWESPQCFHRTVGWQDSRAREQEVFRDFLLGAQCFSRKAAWCSSGSGYYLSFHFLPSWIDTTISTFHTDLIFFFHQKCFIWLYSFPRINLGNPPDSPSREWRSKSVIAGTCSSPGLGGGLEASALWGSGLAMCQGRIGEIRGTWQVLLNFGLTKGLLQTDTCMSSFHWLCGCSANASPIWRPYSRTVRHRSRRMVI